MSAESPALIERIMTEKRVMQNRYVKAATTVIEQHYPREKFDWVFEYPIYNPKHKPALNYKLGGRCNYQRQRLVVDLAIKRENELVCVVEIGDLHTGTVELIGDWRRGRSPRIENLKRWLPKSVAFWWLPKVDLEHIVVQQSKENWFMEYRIPPPLRKVAL